MKRILISLLLLLSQAYAQKPGATPVDSLVRQLKYLKQDTLKINALKKITKYYQENNPDKSLQYGKEGLALAFRLKNLKDICLFYDYQGETLAIKGDFKSAFDQYNKQYNLAAQYNNKHYMANAYTEIGVMYEMEGNYTTAQDYFFKCLNIAEQNNETHLIAIAFVNICVVYFNQDNPAKTIEYAKKTLNVLNQAKSPKGDVVAKAYEMLGSTSINLKDYTSAQAYYNQALAIYLANKQKLGTAIIYTSLVSAYVKNPQKQLEYGFKAKALWDDLAPKNLYAINNLGNIGAAYGDMVRDKLDSTGRLSPENRALLKKAESYLIKAIDLAKETNSKQNIIELSDNLSVIEAFAGNYKEAYLQLKMHNTVGDSVFSQDSKNKIASLEGRHEIALRDKQLLINKLALANQEKQRWFLIAGIVSLFIIAGLIYNQSVQRKKANVALSVLNKQLDEANKIKTRFFSILNHDLRSPVASFVNFLHLQQQAPDLMDKTASVAYSKKATESAETLLNTMEDLLLWSKGQMENFKPHIKAIPVSELFEYIQSLKPAGSEPAMSFNQQSGMVLHTDEHYIKTIMQNLTSNAIKALNGVPKGIIAWEAWQEGPLNYISITDNGPGTKSEQLKALYDDSAPIGIKSGLGLHIVRDLAKAINCQIAVHPGVEAGVKVVLMFNNC